MDPSRSHRRVHVYINNCGQGKTKQIVHFCSCILFNCVLSY